MNLLVFNNKQEDNETVPTTLTHLSISIEPDNYSVKEERGLHEVFKTFTSKADLLKYIEENL